MRVAEHTFGERLAELGLAHAGGPEEDEGAERARRVVQTDAGAPDGARHRVHRLLLPDDHLVQRLLEVEQPLALRLGEAGRVDAGDVRHELRDVLGGELLKASVPAVLPIVLRLLQTRAQVALPVADARRALEILGADRRLLLSLEGGQLVFQLPQAVRNRNAVHLYTRAGLVDQVDRLVGQAAVGDIPRGQRHGRFDRLVEDADAVVLLVPLAQALDDRDRVLLARLLHEDRLEPAFEGAVLFDELAVLVDRRRAHELEFPARELGL